MFEVTVSGTCTADFSVEFDSRDEAFDFAKSQTFSGWTSSVTIRDLGIQDSGV
jgi:hypothetical protein